MKKLFLLLLAVITIGLCASAQTRTVRGTVVDAETHEELIGASVTAGSAGVVTDASGDFSIKVPVGTKHITISYVGYKSQQVAVPEHDDKLYVMLRSDSELLSDVMVVAYGQQSKASFTGSAAVVGGATIEKTQVTNPLNALSGRVTGLQISNASGAPGASSPTMNIRGFTSVNTTGNSPLVIVDGAPFSGSLNAINSNDIESMTVLKDAASAALYGARGANGVILVTTKRAKLGEAKVTVDAKWGGNSRATQDYDYIKNPAQYYEAYYGAYNRYYSMPASITVGEGDAERTITLGGMGYSAAAANAAANSSMLTNLGYNVYTVPDGQQLIGMNGKLNPNATLGRMVTMANGQQFWLMPDNWLDYTYKSSLRQEYNVNISQGTDKSNIMASVGYLRNEGIVVSPSNFERISARVAADFQAKPWLKVGMNANYSNVSIRSMSSEGSSNSTANMFAFATEIAPIYPLFMRDGNKQIMYDERGFARYDYGAAGNAGLRRPLFPGSNAISDSFLNTDKSDRNVFGGTAFAEIRFLKDFKFTTNNTVNVSETRTTSTTNPYYGQMATQGGIVSKQHTRYMDMNFQQLLTYNHTFAGLHEVDALLGHEYYRQTYAYLYGSRTGMFDNANDELDGAILANGPASSYKDMYNSEGYFFRGQYNYDQRYFGSVSYRRDASSRFHPKHRWGNFWSVGAAWLISQEAFFNVDWVNLLKFKAAYGVQGNDKIGDFLYTNTYSVVNSDGSPSVVPSSKGNELITWEKNGNVNLGLEFNLFNSRLNGEINGYYRRTSDMLMYYSLPASSGFMGYYANVGNVMNAGIEVQLDGDIIKTNDFVWNMNLNFTWYKNKITSLPAQRKNSVVDGVAGYSSSNYYYGEGEPLYTFYMPEYLGVNPENGKPQYKYKKIDEEGNETGEWVATEEYGKASNCLVGSALAPVFGGFTTTFEYKGFDLSAQFNYQIGGKVYDSGYAALMGSPTSTNNGANLHADVFKAWTPDNTGSNIPRFVYNDLNSTSVSSRFITNASYLSLENINFGYTFPSQWIKKLYLSKLRVYLSCENIWVWSKRQGLDPRQSYTGGNNNTYNAPVRTISGGLTLTF